MEPADALQALFTPTGRAERYPHYAVLLDQHLTSRISPVDRAAEAHVRAYQKMRGLAVDGVVGPVTWREMLGH